jgi:hypothetical protein
MDKEKDATVAKRKNHNNIKAIGNPKTLKYLNLDLNSPMMRDAMNQLGLEDNDLDYSKCVEDFKPKKGEAPCLDKIVTMRYNHYRDRCIETINRVLDKRRTIKER